MTEQTGPLHSARSLTDFLHMVGIAAPIFLILLGCYLLYKDLISDPLLRVTILVALLIGVAVVAPLGSRLKNLEITEHGLEVRPFSTEHYRISFDDIEHFSLSPIFGIVKLRIGATPSLPRDSVWFIPERRTGQSRHMMMSEVETLLAKHLHDRSKNS